MVDFKYLRGIFELFDVCCCRIKDVSNVRFLPFFSDRDASLLPPLGISTAFMGGELMGGNLRTSPNPQINAAGINRPQTARTVTPQDFAAFAPPVSNSFAAAMTDDFFAQSEPLVGHV